MSQSTEDPGLTERERAERIVRQIKETATITGMIGIEVKTIPTTLKRIASMGVQDNLDLPYDSDTLRTLVQELAQKELD